MKCATSLLLALLLGTTVFSQNLYKPSPYEISQAPDWAREMYNPAPRLGMVDAGYAQWRASHPAEKNIHSQYYKRWRRAVADWNLDAEGRLVEPSPAEIAAREAALVASREAAPRMGNPWTLMGPNHVMDNANTRSAHQTNVYCIDRCEANPSVLYCGTETALIFKSTDGGNNWTAVSYNISVSSPGALEIDPTNPDIVYVGAGNFVWKTVNGGSTWNQVLNVSNLGANEILVNPSNPNLVLVASNKGLRRSTDAGASWNVIYSDECYDIKFRANSNATVYLLKDNPAVVRCEFLASTDSGATFTPQLTGFYASTDPGRYDGGARLAVTPADPNRIYAYLIGQAKNGDSGFIGLYRSTDGGATWTLPNGPDGGPYSVAHPNLAVGSPTWDYHQGFYNCALMASPTNADHVLIGGLNLWRSNDGGATFSSVAGYIGGPLNMHVDMQDFRSFGTEQWISCDGGIYRSTDFFNTQPTVKMDGVHGSDYWGFGSGWNEDVLVGGLYHNGNLAWHENYANGEFLSLGGGEASTGYVNPALNRRTFFSDIGGRILPNAIGDPVAGVPFALAPNESYGAAESSEFEFHPHCYNIAFLGKDNKLWKTVDGGASFTLVDSFAIGAGNKIQAIEISRSNPDVMFITQRPASGNTGWLRRTSDGGDTWTSISLPGNTGFSRNRILIQLDPENENIIYLAYPGGSNNNKVYKSINGGANWTNITSSSLDGQSIHSLVHIGGSNGALYAFTNTTCFYTDNSLSSWIPYDGGLPMNFSTDIARPFYRDSKIRSASYGKGIWQAPLMNEQDRPVATPTVDKWSAICTTDTFYFEDFSMLRHAGASWNWTFQGGTPATSTLRNPQVTFNSQGTHLVTLTVTDDNGVSDSDSLTVEITGITSSNIAETFEGSFLPLNWTNVATGALSWSQTNAAGGFGSSFRSAFANNYDIDATGTWADMRAPVNFSNIQNALLTFDVAYTPWGGGPAYSDSLEVRVSTDCGLNWDVLYHRGGMDLSTTGATLSSTIFIPNSLQWRKDSVDLSAYSSQPLVLIAFRNLANWGQALYLDNINVSGSQIVSNSRPQGGAFAQLYPNPTTTEGVLQFQCEPGGNYEVTLNDLTGKEILRRRMSAGDQIDLAPLSLSAGAYGWSMEGSTLMQFGKLVLVNGR